ncbi:glycosyltransferase [Paenibacillus zeisoli]|uniref:Glycosyltransferase n=1 Tax=Paenibacillus zeisoli TaxID=2496267 RepID=A0A433XGN0_9BACL|nr:glycosyltransferase family 2 protein [Paenibacillus zeisoli]RUT33271.1 glycosyltransferase [Paenibacillus zeisoli]
MGFKQKMEYLISNGNYTEAKETISLYEELMESEPEFYSIKAVLAIIENDLEAAEAELLKGLEIDPKYSDILYNLAYVYKLRKQHLESIDYYTQAYLNTKSEEIKSLIVEGLDEVQEDILSFAIKPSAQPLVSIVVLAYNKLQYTKLCVNSILKYTRNIDYELILVNNGSTDETLNFFNSIPYAKVVDLKENAGIVNGFNAGIMAATGKYTAAVCNDLIFTPRWMDNLLTCIESDESIGFVSSGATNISNNQLISGPFNNLKEMLEFSEEYNRSNPRKWEERVRLIPCVLMVRTELLQRLEGFDPAFYYGEFADDDLSFRIRRCGYKLIYCKDTFTFHFGSVTSREAQVNNNSLGVSRQIFSNIYDLDAWEDASFDYQLMDALNHNVRLDQDAKILAINAKCGGNPLQLKNMLKELGQERITVTNYFIDLKYETDLHTVSDHVINGSNYGLANPETNEKFNYIILEDNEVVLVENSKLMDELIRVMDENCHIALKFVTDHGSDTEEKIGAIKSELELLGFNFLYEDRSFLNTLRENMVFLVGERQVS